MPKVPPPFILPRAGTRMHGPAQVSPHVPPSAELQRKGLSVQLSTAQSQAVTPSATRPAVLQPMLRSLSRVTAPVSSMPRIPAIHALVPLTPVTQSTNFDSATFTPHSLEKWRYHSLRPKSKRLAFTGPVKSQREAAVRKVGARVGQPLDWSHLISYANIKWKVMHAPRFELLRMINAITIPQRRFGRVPKGDLEYYTYAMEAYKARDAEKLLRILASSPFICRLGLSSINRSIGDSADLVWDNNELDPQSEAIIPFSNLISSKTSALPSKRLRGEAEDATFEATLGVPRGPVIYL